MEPISFLISSTTKTRETGLEPAISGVTGQRDNQLRYSLIDSKWKLLHIVVFVNIPQKKSWDLK